MMSTINTLPSLPRERRRGASTTIAGLCLAAAGWLVVVCSLASAYESLRGPTELLHWDREKAYSGYTLFAAHGTTYLIDMEGQVVNTWRMGTNPRLLDNGHILDATRDDPSGFQGFQELDWDGKDVWRYTETRDGYAPHHDSVRIHNRALDAPTTLYIANRSISHEQAIAAGCDPRNGPYRGAQMDAVVEIGMDGNVVWEWWFFDHVVQDVDASKANYTGEGRTVADYPGRIDLNLPGRPLKRDWLHCNSLDYNAESGHIVINSVQGEFYVIDHDGTFVPDDPSASIAKAAGPAGDFLYRFGDPARYGHGDPPRILEDCLPMTNAVFRAYRYGPGHPALRGRDLTPKGTITDAFPREPRPDRGGDRPRRGGGRSPDRQEARRSEPANPWGGWRKEKP